MISAIVDSPLPAPSRSRQAMWPMVPRGHAASTRLGRSPPAARVLSTVLPLGWAPLLAIAEGVRIRAPWGIRLDDQVAMNFYASLDGQGSITCGQRALHRGMRDAPHHRASSADAREQLSLWLRAGGGLSGLAAVVHRACHRDSGTREISGQAALVGAGAVVTHEVGECEVVAGVPARAISSLDRGRAVPAGGTGTPVL